GQARRRFEGGALRVRYVLGITLLGGAAYFALFGGDYSLLELRRIRADVVLEQQRTAELRAEVQQLKARADSLMTDERAIERVARERWGLIRPGERLYRFEDATAPDPTR
ncbi:MAG: FtsB family cell division protein, partial [Longimicrobiales bacterium]